MPTSQEISIFSLPFVIRAPYSAGQEIGQEEARALNALRAENIRNLVRKKIEDVLQGGIPTIEQIIQLQEYVSKVDGRYILGAKGPTKTKNGLKELIAEIARETAAAALSREGIVVGEENLTKAMEYLINDRAVLEEAQRRFWIRRNSAKEFLDEILQTHENRR